MIHIPNPCHEDFSKMTPTERGSFCNKCSTDTYDFRKMAVPEIKFILENAESKVCGQIYQHQINKINADYTNWNNPKTFQSKFLVALLFGFGLSLFSCDGNESRLISSLQKIKPNLEFVSPNTINTCTNPDDFNLTEFVVPAPPPEVVELLVDDIWDISIYPFSNLDSTRTLPTVQIVTEESDRLGGQIVTAGYILPFEPTPIKRNGFGKKGRMKNLFNKNKDN